MAQQLTLLERQHDWQLDERTKEIGKRGLAAARAELAAHRPASPTAPASTDQRRTAA